MAFFNKFKGIKGFLSIYERVIRFRYMITEEAKRKTRILAFWEKHGLEATKEAFDVSRPTLFRWQKALKDNIGKIEALNNKSRAPKTKRKRKIPELLKDFIINERRFDPKLSKEKLSVFILLTQPQIS